MCVLPEAVMARSISSDNGIRPIVSVLRMTTCFAIMGHVALGVGSIDVTAVLVTK